MVDYAGGPAPVPRAAVLGEPPLVHGVTVRPGSPPEPASETSPPVVLRVVGGPDAGSTHRLRPGGTLTVGRGCWCDVVIDDPALSRVHLTLSTTRRGVLIEDTRSTNGTRLDDTMVVDPTVWAPGVPLRIGSSTLVLSPTAEVLPRAVPDGEGRLVVTPRVVSPPPLNAVQLEAPDLSLPPAPVPPGALGWLLPMGVSALLAVLLRMPALLLFGLMAPAMSLGGYAGERRRHRRECATAEAAHDHSTAAVGRAAAEAVRAELGRRAERVPDLAHLIEHAERAGPLLWCRPPDAPVCRIGRGPVSTAVSVEGRPEMTDDAPLELELSEGLAIVGQPERARAMARTILLQLAALHPPGDLAIRLPGSPGQHASDAGTWDWLGWLPHARTPDDAPITVILTDLTLQTSAGAAPQEAPEPAPESQPPFGADDASQKMTVRITLHSTDAQVRGDAPLLVLDGDRISLETSGGPAHGRADLLSLRRARRAARALAPLRDTSVVGESGAVPQSVELATIVPPPTAEALSDQWRQAPRSTRFAIGCNATDPVFLDLATDGPHALVAGTTGAGKSELLRTLVTSLALVNRPDELVMVLVDYKGGSAFADASGLPHVVGVITDLDPHLADRALTSLTAELKRREHILAEAGAPDLTAYQALPEVEPLARLVIVIDEFRAMAEELPDFLDGLIRIAALGRSLGVHLVLATQRPGGVVSADVRANVNLRIALRVRDATDSYDVIESPAAADLPEGVPGRALIRTGTDAPRTVQVASCSAPVRDAAATPVAAAAPEQVSIVPVHDLWLADEHPPAAAGEAAGPSFLTQVIAAAQGAAAAVGAVPPASPWLPDLPDQLTLGELEDRSPAAGWCVLPLLLTDVPARQCQPVHHWEPLADGHLGVAGAARSGRSTVVRSALAGLLSHDPTEVHVYAYDLASSLGRLDSAPHLGAVIGAADVTRGTRVLEHLAHLVSERQRDLAVHGYTSLREQRDRSARPWPLVVLVIDGWARFAEIYGEADRGRPLDRLLRILREGLAVGVVGLVTGDRSLLSGRVAPLLTEMWSLRLTDPSDLLLAGLTRAQVPARMPPGRVVRLRDGVVGQVAVLGDSADGADQVAGLAALVDRARVHCTEVNGGSEEPAGGPTVFRALPLQVPLEAVCAAPTDGVPLGVGGASASAVALPEPRSGTAAYPIVGPPGSGRTSTLQTVERSAQGRGWRVVRVTDALLHDLAGLREALGSGDEPVLVSIDGLDRVSSTPAEEAVLDWLDARGTRTLLVVSADADSLGGFRGLAARLGRDRTGVVLQPADPSDGSGLGVAVPTGDEPVPGRGVLVVRGTCTSLQVARATP